MRLLEIVVLMGSHCVSPVQHLPAATEAGKVQCAVLVERDTGSSSVTVTPAQAASDPRVAAAIARQQASVAEGMHIVPAGASAGTPARSMSPLGPAGSAAVPAAEPPPAVRAPLPRTAPGAKPAPLRRAAAAERTTSQCTGKAVAKWYTNANGHRKYRCIRAK